MVPRITYNLNGYTFVKPDEITRETHASPVIMYDIEVEDDHTFLIKHNDDRDILMKNCDGSHIAGLIIGFFKKYSPGIIRAGRLKKLRTPIVTLKKKGKIVKFFFTLAEFREFEATNDLKGYECNYLKGLGSWRKEDLRQLITDNGFDYFVQTLTYDEQTDDVIHNWLSFETSDKRKEYIQAAKFNADLT